MAKIISLSRRTDIPFYFSEWFVEILRKGFLDIKLPFNKKALRVNLKKSEILGFVFWSKNFKPLLKHLEEIEEYSNNFHFHFTINQHPENIEPLNFNLKELVSTFEFLSKRYGINSISWRFDPVLPSSVYPFEEQIKNFKKIGSALKGMTEKCITSFMFPYKKVKKSLSFVEDPLEKREEILKYLRDEALKLNMKIYLCCSFPLIEGIEPSKCIDSLSFFKIEGKKSPTRRGCNCDYSIDLGKYRTCKSKCLYCYAS